MSPVEGDGNALIPARIRNGTERRAAEEDVLNIAMPPAKTFFRSLVEHLARSLEAEHAFIASWKTSPIG